MNKFDLNIHRKLKKSQFEKVHFIKVNELKLIRVELF